MKNSILFAIAGFIVISIYISGCSGTSSQPVTPTTVDSTIKAADYFTMKTGNKWVYDFALTDTSKIVIDSTKRIDTTTIKGTIALAAKTASIYVNSRYSITSKKDSVDTNYFILEGEKYYEYILSIGFQTIKLPISRWILYADFSVAANATWAIYDTNVTNMPLNIPGIGNVLYTGKASMTGARGSSISLPVNGVSVNAQEFLQTITLDGNISGISLKGTRVSHIWIGKNTGIINIITDPVVITTPLTSGKIFGGEQTMLKTYTPGP